MGYAAHNALADADLSASAYKFFHKMCALQNRKDHGLVLVESQVKFAEQVGMSQASVSRAFKHPRVPGIHLPRRPQLASPSRLRLQRQRGGPGAGGAEHSG